jgi:hypothetical protein
MPINAPGSWKFFLSHVQADAKADALDLFGLLPDCWLDVKMNDQSVEAMMEGVSQSKIFLCILSKGFWKSTYCCKEMEEAKKLNKPVVSTYTQGVHVGQLLNEAPSSLNSWIKGFDAVELIRTKPEFTMASVKLICEKAGISLPGAKNIIKFRDTDGDMNEYFVEDGLLCLFGTTSDPSAPPGRQMLRTKIKKITVEERKGEWNLITEGTNPRTNKAGGYRAAPVQKGKNLTKQQCQALVDTIFELDGGD